VSTPPTRPRQRRPRTAPDVASDVRSTSGRGRRGRGLAVRPEAGGGPARTPGARAFPAVSNPPGLVQGKRPGWSQGAPTGMEAAANDQAVDRRRRAVAPARGGCHPDADGRSAQAGHLRPQRFERPGEREWLVTARAGDGGPEPQGEAVAALARRPSRSPPRSPPARPRRPSFAAWSSSPGHGFHRRRRCRPGFPALPGRDRPPPRVPPTPPKRHLHLQPGHRAQEPAPAATPDPCGSRIAS